MSVEAFAGPAIAERGMLVAVPLPDDGIPSGREGVVVSVMSQDRSSQKLTRIGRIG